ncbi:MAG: type II toxin-antitoxin system HicA family toxin [Burkholderiaceae bacterium]|nr:type II toxin-antitoxin system HicA family toxin [Burkholderiaceae bacterium]
MAVSFCKQLVAVLRENGCTFYKQADGSHERWMSPINGKRLTVPSKIMPRDMANVILKQVGINRKLP